MVENDTLSTYRLRLKYQINEYIKYSNRLKRKIKEKKRIEKLCLLEFVQM